MVWPACWAGSAHVELAAAGAGVLLVTALIRRSTVAVGAAVLVGVGAAAGALGAARSSATLGAFVPDGPVAVEGRVLDDPRPFGAEVAFPLAPQALVRSGAVRRWRGPRLVVTARDASVAAGDTVRVTGTAVSAAGRHRGDPVGGRIAARSVEVIAPAADPLFRFGNLLRLRVQQALDRHPGRAEAALLAGFLIGDVRRLPAADAEALRLAGLSHFVAVSGSNVAMFLTAWWLAAGPLGWSPRRRAILGLVGLAVFVVATRWEPSVVRAATMAGLVLAGRLGGVPVDPWTALGGSVTLLLVVSPELVGDVGFQLSVAATAGVILGAGVFASRRPRWAWTALAATLSAQAAVAPLLLVHFGSIPLFAPLTNVVAAPLVGFATSVGGVGVISGIHPVTALGLLPARLVLEVARAAADLPQLGTGGVALVALGMGAATRRRLRPLLALAGAVAVAAVSVVPARPPGGPLVEFLDVGQGDAVLLRGPGGEVVLIDGGPDPALLRSELRRREIERIDLLVVTHRHADHTTGLLGLAGSVAVGRAWVADQAGAGTVFDDVLAECVASGIPVEIPSPGWRADVGSFTLTVLGPRRRYAGPNDGSVVLLVEAAERSVLLPGDVEAVAQAELGPLGADVMKVPHQGAATSDPAWLAASAPRIAVVSVGPNDFGHPAPEVIGALEGAGALVYRTDLHGTVAIRLDEM